MGSVAGRSTQSLEVMSNVGSTAVWIAAVLLVAFCVLVYVSAWLKGAGAFLITVGALFATFGVLAIEAISTEKGVLLALSLFAYVLLSGMFFYFVGGRYLTQTPVQDLTYQSHTALVRFIEENSIASPLAALLRVLGPILLVGMLLFAIVALWAKSNGSVT